MQPAIRVQNLEKTFPTRKKGRGIKDYLFPETFDVSAIQDLNFSIMPGEKIAFIGPNGAGKSTTIKILTGIIHPTKGNVEVIGLNPFQNRKKVAKRIGIVFGQRSQLWQHLPAIHSFKLLGAIYDIPKLEFKKRLDSLVATFELEPIMERVVRHLSLGERMRCELVSSLLHQPDILFLDEPTIGLDLVSKSAIRSLISERSKNEGTAIFLTSHDIHDIERVSERIILINRGKIVLDSPLSKMKKEHLHHKQISITSSPLTDWVDRPGLKLKNSQHDRHLFELNLKEIGSKEAIQLLSQTVPFTDITIEDAPLEEIIKNIYIS